MSTFNTNINVNVIDSVNNIVTGASVIITVAGTVYNLTTNTVVFASCALSLTNITIATINISADGYLNNTDTYVISPLTNQFNIVLSVDPSQINKTLQIFDTNSTPIPDVFVSINGNVIGKTNNLGAIQVVTASGYLTIQTNKAGYDPLYIGQIYTSFNFPSQLIISSALSNPQIISFQTTPYASITISGNSINDAINADSTGLAVSNILLNPGIYNITISKTGYISNTNSLTIRSGIVLYSLEILQAIDNTNPIPTPNLNVSSLSSGQPNGFPITGYGVTLNRTVNQANTPGAIPSTSSKINTSGTVEQDYPSEWIYPNSSDGKYLTGSQTRIYIGNLFIDEVDTCYYAYSNNRIPVYGYSSPNVDAFGQGRRLVQGQLTLNYVSEGYLFTVLSEYSKKHADANLSKSELDKKNAIASLASLHTQQAYLLSQQANGDFSSNIVNQLTIISNQILSAYSNLSPDAMTQVKQVLADSASAKSTSNAIIKDVAFDIIIKASGGGRTTTRKLSRCLLTNNEQVWDQSDNLIKDVYGFIGVELN